MLRVLETLAEGQHATLCCPRPRWCELRHCSGSSLPAAVQYSLPPLRNER
jgi:hypothetical protein